MRLHKKSQGGPSGDWPVFIIILLFVVPVIIFLFIAIINSTVSYKARVPYDQVEYILVNKFLSSGECFAYYDRTSGDFVSLSVDLKKFNDEQIKECYPAPLDYYALRFSIIDGDNTHELNTVNWQDTRGAQKRLKPQLITLYKEGKKTNTQIIIEIQNV